MKIARIVLALVLSAVLWIITVAANGPVDSQLWQLFTVVLAVISPIGLRYLPARLKGFPMLVVAVVVSSALGVLNMYIGGQFNHFDIGLLAFYLAAFAGGQQLFFAALKDSWHLADPPGAFLAPGQPAAYKP